MNKIAILHGPNLNLLGKRETEFYGTQTLEELNQELINFGKNLEIEIICFQTNYEGGLIGYIQQCPIYDFDAIIINPAAYTHTSIAILDALKAINLPFIEVHMSDIDKREEFRKTSYIRSLATAVFKGDGINSYKNAIEYFYQNKKSDH